MNKKILGVTLLLIVQTHAADRPKPTAPIDIIRNRRDLKQIKNNPYFDQKTGHMPQLIPKKHSSHIQHNSPSQPGLYPDLPFNITCNGPGFTPPDSHKTNQHSIYTAPYNPSPTPSNFTLQSETIPSSNNQSCITKCAYREYKDLIDEQRKIAAGLLNRIQQEEYAIKCAQEDIPEVTIARSNRRLFITSKKTSIERSLISAQKKETDRIEKVSKGMIAVIADIKVFRQSSSLATLQAQCTEYNNDIDL